ncbi:MAG TPA: hypothetical protein VG816_00445 [Solirubrobacterales bacterium]|nr:hypothetical protein [Solirubrobacterales bacterium]
MKRTQKFGFALLAMAVSMFAMTAVASATPEDPLIGLCKTNTPILCASGSLFHVPSGGSIGVLTEAKNPILKGTLTEKCNTSLSQFKTSEEDKTVLNGQITNLTFTGSCTPCSTVKTLGLPYTAKLSGSGEDYVLSSSGGAELSGCTFGVTCKFEGTGVTLLGVNTAEGAEFKAEEEELKQTGGNAFFCGSTGKWTANYKVIGVDLYNSSGTLLEEHKGPAWITLLK